MKVLMFTLMLMSSSVFAWDYGVYLKSGAEGEIRQDLQESLNHSLAKHIKDIHVFRLKKDESYIKLSVKDLNTACALNRELNNGRLEILQGWITAWVGTLETLRVPTFVSHEVAPQQRPLVTYGYYKVDRFSLQDINIQIIPLSVFSNRNVRDMNTMGERAPETVNEDMFSRDLNKHQGLLTALGKMGAKSIRGGICDSLFCSCYGISSCFAVKQSCKKLHELVGSKFTDKFTCVKNLRGLCISGSCRLH